MKAHILSFNVKRLNMEKKAWRLGHYLKGIHPLLDQFIFIQEHKLKGDKAKEVGKVGWRRATSWLTKASRGYSTQEKST